MENGIKRTCEKSFFLFLDLELTAKRLPDIYIYE